MALVPDPAPPGRRPWRDRWGTAVAMSFAWFSAMGAVSFAAMDAEGEVRMDGWIVLSAFAALGVAVAVVWRRRHPMAVLVGSALPALVMPLDGFVPLLALTWVIAQRPVRTAWLGGVLAALSTAVSLGRDARREGAAVIFSTVDDLTGERSYLPGPGYLAIGITLLGIAVAVGLVRRSRMETAAALAAQQAQSRTAAELRTELTRQEERELIAREVHDTVAHQLSLVSLHAAALEVGADDPATDVTAAARSMRASAHRALEEMHTLIVNLRDAGARIGPGAYVDTPALDDLPRLVDDAREAGAPVTATVFVSEAAAAPPAMSRAVYRIVQESLTNALKHAPGLPVHVALRAAPGAGVDIAVRNALRPGAVPAGPPASGTPPVAGSVAGPVAGAARASGPAPAPAPTGPAVPTEPGGGAGLVGMRERVEHLGGTLDARVVGQEFVVRAHLPWPAEG